MSNAQYTSKDPSLIITLLPMAAVVFVAFVVVGLALPVLPLHVHINLGLSTFAVGLVSGAQFAASFASRIWAGHRADSKGGKKAVITGLLTAAVAGVIYYVSLMFSSNPHLSAGILIAGRAILGGAESFIITGALSWGLAIAGPGNTGKVMSWMGTAMYVAFAIGAPIGTALYSMFGFTAIAVATVVAPLASLLLVMPLRKTAPQVRMPASIGSIVKAIWAPGLGLALASFGFGTITTFAALLFVGHEWSGAWLAFTAFSLAFVLARVVFGHLPDKIGGAKVALMFVVVEAVGLAMIWLASTPLLASLGAGLTGFGYSLVYPGLGVEAVRRAPPQSRGLAMGTYTAFLDLTLGIAGPVLGLIAASGGVPVVFLVSAVMVACAAVVAVFMLRGRPMPDAKAA